MLMTVSDCIRIKDVRVLSDSHYVLKTTTFEWRRAGGDWQTQHARPTIAATGRRCWPTTWRGRTVLLTRQFRYPAFSTATTIS